MQARARFRFGSRRSFAALAVVAVLAPLAWNGSPQAAEARRPGPAPTTTTLAGSSATFDVRDLPQLPHGGGPGRDDVGERHGPGGIESPTGDLAAVGSGSAPEAAAPAIDTSFEGLAYNEDCDGTQCGDGHPPDTNGDVGPTYYIQTINTAIGIYSKATGARVAAFSFNAFMSQGSFGNLCDTDNFGDPVVLYDTFANRWVITDFAFQVDGSGNVVNPPGAYQCIAVSQSGDPVAGGWNFYSLHLTDGLQDYPKLGIWPDGIYMSANMFDFAASGSFQNVRVWALNKAQMYAGQAAQAVSFDAAARTGPCSVFTLLPSNARAQAGTPPAGRENLFASTWCYTGRVRIWKFHVDWANTANSTFLGPTDSTTSANWSSGPGTVPELNGNNLDTLGIRLMAQNQYANIGGVESLWNSHTVAGSSGSQAAVRWYQVPVTGGTIGTALQSSTYNPDTKNRFMPSIAVDRIGNMALGYSVTDATMHPSIRYAGRLAGDAANQVTQAEQVLIDGTGSQVGNCGGGPCERWGDYSAMTLDPDGCTFWYTNEYYVSDGLNHHTRIGSFRYQSCVDAPPPTAPPATPTPAPPTPTPTPAPPTPTPAPPTPSPTAAVTAAPDLTPPTVTNVLLSPASVIPGATVTVTATASDPSGVAGAEKRLAAGSWTAMAAVDGAFGETAEDVTSTIAAPGTAGAYQVCVRATDTKGNTSSGATCATLTVMSFSLSASPTSLSVPQGAAAGTTVTIARSSFTAAVDLGATGLPAGTVATFSADPTAGTSSTLTLTTSNCGTVTPRGTYTVTISGTALGLTRTTTVGLTVANAAPKVTAPAPSLYGNTTITSSTVRVKEGWSACDPDGISSYQLQRQVNGGSWTTVTLASATATSINQSLTRGTTYRFRVRATDKTNLTSGWAYGPSFVPRVADQSTSAFTYGGSWSTGTSSAYWGGTTRYTGTAGRTATYAFSGSSVAWVAYKGSTRGSARVYIDNVLVATISLYATTSTARAQVFAYNWATEGNHTIRIEVLGTAGHARVDVDAMVRIDRV